MRQPMSPTLCKCSRLARAAARGVLPRTCQPHTNPAARTARHEHTHTHKTPGAQLQCHDRAMLMHCDAPPPSPYGIIVRIGQSFHARLQTSSHVSLQGLALAPPRMDFSMPRNLNFQKKFAENWLPNPNRFSVTKS